jgi:hypothetical protein
MFPGEAPLTSQFQVASQTRKTVLINTVVGDDREVSLYLHADRPIVAERPIYFNYHGAITDGHTAAGIP